MRILIVINNHLFDILDKIPNLKRKEWSDTCKCGYIDIDTIDDLYKFIASIEENTDCYFESLERSYKDNEFLMTLEYKKY